MITSEAAGYTASVVLGQIQISNGTQSATSESAVALQLVELADSVLLYWIDSTGKLTVGTVTTDLILTNKIELVPSNVTTFFAKNLPGVGTAFAYVIGTTLTINVAGTITLGSWSADRLLDFSFDVSNDLQTITVLYRAGEPAQAYVETYQAMIKAEAPTFTPAAGTYQGAISITMATNTPDAVIRYTLDGSEPTDSSTVYTGPVGIAATSTVKAITTAAGYLNSDVTTGSYTLILTPKASAPVFSPVGGSYTTALSVAITSTTPNKIIRYTLDGSTPTLASPIYYGPISVTADIVIKAYATAAGYLASDVSTASYVINIPEPTPEDHVDPNYSYLWIYDFKMGLREATGFAVDHEI